LRTSRETSKGATDNKVSVYVETPTGIRPYETLSGGQKFRVDLAIRAGLAAAIARGTGTPIRTFILDEGWGTLDEKGVLSTIDTLFRLSEETNVLTVSHIDSVRDAFPARVEVRMDGGTSVAELVA
ncbi:SbcC/MukB-like Walker B domain-containing protein, partial [Agromyces humi]|uniref:SbcC/MukB-like Walker B domain-containing protein n=1 Tax=Agromyces humi TaxID=1766800 RepID=UPI0022A68CFA